MDERIALAKEREQRRKERQRRAALKVDHFDSRIKRLEEAQKDFEYRLRQMEQLVLVMAKEVGSLSPATTMKPRPDLSRREREVVEAFATGLSRSEVARELGITPHTVSSHMWHVYGKMPGVSRCVTAVLAEGFRNGWLRSPNKPA